ncbi:MAG TPA: DNA-formamidopyrimidine glycosylase family protein [Lacunisphaera sp.]|nr:DNA-formamidopyrimidine glycosylase family protein [Lacunisphaera sp.]
MPELPDITVYLEALQARVVGQVLERVRVLDIFVLRTAVPPITALEGTRLVALRRLGKRLVFGFEGDRWLVLHLMIAGRLQWQPMVVAGLVEPGGSGANAKRSGSPTPATATKKIPNALVQFVFPTGVLTLTEAGTKHRASLHVLAGEAGLAAHERGGIDVFAATTAEFAAALTRENHTLKRALTDPRLFSGIGNAYSDEILHAARLSPVALTSKLKPEEITRLHEATKRTLIDWTERLRSEAKNGFPARVTAFRPEMAVHGKFGQPCPVCGTKVQRIRYAENEVNYCPRCQTGGKLLADRSLSRLLKGDWPKTIDEAEDLGRA